MSETKGKVYYSISEVCTETELEQHVLRYWETEFAMLKPKKNRAGNRAYRHKEIALIKTIKQLLYDDQYTIQGAKKVLASPKGGEKGENDGFVENSIEKSALQEKMEKIKEDLLQLKQEIDDVLKEYP